jgi:hypothetical protein
MISKVVIASDYKGAVDDINSKSGGLCSTIIKEIELSVSDLPPVFLSRKDEDQTMRRIVLQNML